jgi:NAD-dependent SIR2 family protein deacetylase
LRDRRVVVLTGAGCSTESGIPDYRGPETRRRARRPIQAREFLRDAAVRRRYWARSTIGWPRIAGAQPNDGHRALAAMEQSGAITGVITQNVDRLHHAAGSREVIELHGALAEVRCLGCGALEERAALQERLLAANPRFSRRRAELAPDGDADLPDAWIEAFRVPACLACAGVLKPRVVFFGENVPRPVVDDAFALLDASDALLVVGSSLAVFSGFRFVRRATARGMPIAIVNLGQTRGHPHAAVCIDARAGVALPQLAQAIVGGQSNTTVLLP